MLAIFNVNISALLNQNVIKEDDVILPKFTYLVCLGLTYPTYSLYVKHTWQNKVILIVKNKEMMNVFLTET